MSETKLEYAFLLKNILHEEASFSDVKNNITEPNRNFFNMLFMTTFRQLTFIKEEVLPQFVKKKISHKHQILEFLLYLAATELLFMDTPDYAVVNSYVDAAKKATDKFGANFVNAVLRNILRNKEQLLKNRQKKFFSSSFVNILKQDYQISDIRQMEEFVTIEPPLDITLKSGYKADNFSGILLETGSFRLPFNTKITDLADFDKGYYWVQDAASALPVKCLPLFEGKKVLDLCAAPGGKTAQLLDGGAYVTALDISEKRLNRLHDNIKRLNLSAHLKTVCTDALSFASDEKFDIILVDAPCSATGTFRRHPEIIHTKSLEDVKKQAQLQKNILNHAINFLAPHGYLCYCTCSLAKLEGEQQIKSFLKEHPDFDIVPIKLSGTLKMQTKEGFLRILPQNLKEFFGIDGFFIALLQRKI